MRFKMKLGLPLFLLVFFMVMACSLGSVSAANDIHDVTTDDTNTVINHPQANIQDTTIYNKLTSTDHISINQAQFRDGFNGAFTNSKLYNQITSSANYNINQGLGGVIQDSMINNMVKNSNGSIHEINQATDAQGFTAYYPGSIQGSMLNNNINDFTGNFLINQGKGCNVQGSMLNNEIDNFTGNLLINQSYGNNIQNSVINNVVINFTQDVNNPSDGLKIHQALAPITNSVINNAVINSNHISTFSGTFSLSQNLVDNSRINNLVYGSEDNILGQFGLTNSQICNVSLFSNDIYLHEGYLSGVNGCWIAIGCNDYQKMITNLTDTNFFCLTIGNHEIFDLRW